MQQNREIYADALHTHLRAFLDDVSITVEGAGVQWQVNAKKGERWCRIHCFSYDGIGDSLVLGMRGNAHLSKLHSGPPRAPKQGAEYLIYFGSGERSCATGRTQEIVSVEGAVRAWVAEQVELAEVYQQCPFVDAPLRKNIEIATNINAALETRAVRDRFILEGKSTDSEFTNLWLYAEDRSCHVTVGAKDAVNLELLLHRTSLAYIENIETELSAQIIEYWTEVKGTLEGVQKISSLTELSAFALEFERGNYAAWHWGNVLAQAENDQILAFYKPLLERVASSPIASRFFSFTSLSNLVFSRCSLYPFDSEGLPVLSPARDRSNEKPYSVAIAPVNLRKLNPIAAACSTEEAFQLIEAHLAREILPSYFGDSNHQMIGDLNLEFEAVGSSLRAEVAQKYQGTEIIIRGKNTTWCSASFISNDKIFFTLHDRSDLSLEKKSATEELRPAVLQIQEWLR
jgi:Family of unknown function (DUF6193)